MTAFQRLREIERIIRNDPRTYWANPQLQCELREVLTELHGGEYEPQSSVVDEPFQIEERKASPEHDQTETCCQNHGTELHGEAASKIETPEENQEHEQRTRNFGSVLRLTRRWRVPFAP
jgi:hypothetical protein